MRAPAGAALAATELRPPPEVRPKGEPPGGTPPTSLLTRTNPFDKHKAVMEKPKELRPGDVVTVRFTTDLERHRIEALQKVGAAK